MRKGSCVHYKCWLGLIVGVIVFLGDALAVHRNGVDYDDPLRRQGTIRIVDRSADDIFQLITNWVVESSVLFHGGQLKRDAKTNVLQLNSSFFYSLSPYGDRYVYDHEMKGGFNVTIKAVDGGLQYNLEVLDIVESTVYNQLDDFPPFNENMASFVMTEQFVKRNGRSYGAVKSRLLEDQRDRHRDAIDQFKDLFLLNMSLLSGCEPMEDF